MVTHMVHAVYEAVDQTAEAAAELGHDVPPGRRRPDEGVGRFLVWAGAVIGFLIAGSSMISIYATTGEFGGKSYDDAFTSEHLPGVVFGTGLGVVAGAGVGLFIWAIVVAVMSRR